MAELQMALKQLLAFDATCWNPKAADAMGGGTCRELAQSGESRKITSLVHKNHKSNFYCFADKNVVAFIDISGQWKSFVLGHALLCCL